MEAVRLQLVEVDGGHEALFTKPSAVTEGLLKAVES
jgi:hypothetical protein